MLDLDEEDDVEYSVGQRVKVLLHHNSTNTDMYVASLTAPAGGWLLLVVVGGWLYYCCDDCGDILLKQPKKPQEHFHLSIRLTCALYSHKHTH